MMVTVNKPWRRFTIVLGVALALGGCASDSRQRHNERVANTTGKVESGISRGGQSTVRALNRGGDAIKKGFSRAGEWVEDKVEAVKK